MFVKDVMTPSVIGVSEDATLIDALRMLVGGRVSGLVVLDGAGAPVGVVSEGDLMRRAELGSTHKRPAWLEFLVGGGRVAEDYLHGHGRLVADVMTRGAVTIAPDAPLVEAVDAMVKHKIKRLVVVSGGKAIGVVARSDLIKALLAADSKPAVERSDSEITAEVHIRLQRESWTPKGSVSCSVADGVVTLDGVITDDRLRGALRALASEIPGVKDVRDDLTWVEPNSGLVVMAPEGRQGDATK